jgi:hypothetical protein
MFTLVSSNNFITNTKWVGILIIQNKIIEVDYNMWDEFTFKNNMVHIFTLYYYAVY